MSDHTHLKSHQSEALIDTYLHAEQKINFITQTVFEILKWPRADFSQICSFNRIIKVIMVHDLNPKNLHINGLSFCKIQKTLSFGYFWALSPK